MRLFTVTECWDDIIDPRIFLTRAEACDHIESRWGENKSQLRDLRDGGPFEGWVGYDGTSRFQLDCHTVEGI